jgi:hypothetical protein
MKAVSWLKTPENSKPTGAAWDQSNKRSFLWLEWIERGLRGSPYGLKGKCPCSGSRRYCDEGKRAGCLLFLLNLKKKATWRPKKVWLIEQRDFWELKNETAISPGKKKFKVARFRHCVPLGSKTIQDPKKSTSLWG